jgi:hypothetical protein
MLSWDIGILVLSRNNIHFHRSPILANCLCNNDYISDQPGKFCVNENFEPIEGSFSETSVNKIQSNHYYCRLLEEYEHKIKRGYEDTSKKRTLDEFFNHDRVASKVQDLTILKMFNPNN